jgi:hypothetical protein
LPVDCSGTVKLPVLPERELVAKFMKDKNIKDEQLCEHFLSMIKDMFTGIANGDQESIRRVAELGFANRIIEETSNVKLKYTPPSDEAINKVYLHDKIFIKGVNAIRSENDTNADYVAQKDEESIGLRKYVHKYHLGLQPYYFKLKNLDDLKMQTDENAEKDPDAYYTRHMGLK